LAGTLRCSEAVPFAKCPAGVSETPPRLRSVLSVPLVNLAPLSLRVTGNVMVNACPARGVVGDIFGVPITGLTLVRPYDHVPPSGARSDRVSLPPSSTHMDLTKKLNSVAPPRSDELSLNV